MTITEYTLKIEHARYKKALETLSRSVAFGETHHIVNKALNPPPPPPVTLVNILAALGAADKGSYLNRSIEIFNDGSAGLKLSTGNTRAFTTVQQALDFLNGAGAV